mgnify:CR=1 FL=1
MSRANSDQYDGFWPRIGKIVADAWNGAIGWMREECNTLLVSLGWAWAGYFWALIFFAILSNGTAWWIALEITLLWILATSLWFLGCIIAGLLLGELACWAGKKFSQPKEVCLTPTVN